MDFKFIPGVLPSDPDPRDYIYSKLVPVETSALPSSFFYDRIPLNKQIIGDCVGEASRAIKYIQTRRDDPAFSFDFSPDFIYAECKKIDGNVDEGTTPKSAMQALTNVGACHKNLYPIITDAKNLPVATQACYDDAKQFKIKSYAKVQTLDEIKTAIQRDGAVLAAVIVCDDFVHCESGGFINLPQGFILGGHAIALDGWDDNMTHTYQDGTTRKGFLRFVNSWGDAWGDKGYGYLPYDFLSYKTIDWNMAYFCEAWTSIDAFVTPAVNGQIVMWVDKNVAIVNGTPVTLDQPPTIDPKTNRTLVPVNFVASNMGYDVQWVGPERKIVMNKK